MQINNPLVEVPINIGALPDWSTRLGYPNLINMFCGDSGYLYPTPGHQTLAAIFGGRAVHYTNFNGGAYIVVTNNSVLKILKTGAVTVVKSQLINSGLPVQIDENLQNQITIVDGARAYVYSQRIGEFIQLTTDQGFSFLSPCSVLVLNTFTIILDKDTGTWAVSDANQAATYPALDTVPQIQSQLGQAVSLETLYNNLYIFGTTGIERWQPSFNINTYLFPFQLDTNFRSDYGAISTNGVIRGLDKIYFLSSEFVPMALDEGGTRALTKDGRPAIGISRIISQYPDAALCITTFFSFRGNYFATYTFPESEISWVWNISSGTWAQADFADYPTSQVNDLIIGAVSQNEVILTIEGLFILTLKPDPKKRTFISERIVAYKGQQNFRNLLNGYEARLVQGSFESTTPIYAELTFSIDSESWLNTVRRQLGKVGERNAIVVWRTNLAAYEYTAKLEFYGDYDFIIEKVTMQIN